MKIKRYISITFVLVVGLLLVHASWPEAGFAKVQTIICPPANTWNVPATSGAGSSGTVCTTYVPSTNAPACQVVTSADTPWDLLGSILRAPFVLGQCVLGGACP